MAEVAPGTAAGAGRGDLPAGFRLVPDPALRRVDGGRVLVGGYPLRLVRLTPAGSATVDGWWSGRAVGAGPGEQRLARRLLDTGMAHPRPARPAPADGAGGDPRRPAGAARRINQVVPPHGRPEGVARVLAAFGPAAAAVVVVDDGSADPRAVRAAAGGARVLRRDRAGGPAAARNAGWRAAETEVVAFVDTDCSDPRPVGGWAEVLLRHLADPAVGAVAPRVVADPGRAPAWLAAYDARRSPLDLGPAEAPVRPRSRVPFVPAAALVVRRAALEEVGGFDEALHVGEDVDLVWRLAGAGWTVRYEPAVTVAHEVRPGLASWARQRFAYGTSAAELDRRHPRAAAPVAVGPWTAASWALAALGHPFSGAALAGGTAALLAPRLRQLEHPWRESARLAGRGHLAGGRLLADAARRAWWPVVAGAALTGRRGRRLAAAVVLLPPLAELRTTTDAPWWVLGRLADDVCYGAGVWAGALRARSAGALLPDLTAWPGRRPAVEGGTSAADQSVVTGG